MKINVKTHPKEYVSWSNMKSRCNNPKNKMYKYYGGRGIVVDESLRSFKNFFAALGAAPDGTTLDRIDNDGPYAAGNVRWADKSTQMNNRSDNRRLTHNGETKTLAEWSKQIGVSLPTIWARLKYGHSVEKALSSTILTAKQAGAIGHEVRWGKKISHQ